MAGSPPGRADEYISVAASQEDPLYSDPTLDDNSDYETLDHSSLPQPPRSETSEDAESTPLGQSGDAAAAVAAERSLTASKPSPVPKQRRSTTTSDTTPSPKETSQKKKSAAATASPTATAGRPSSAGKPKPAAGKPKPTPKPKETQSSPRKTRAQEGTPPKKSTGERTSPLPAPRRVSPGKPAAAASTSTGPKLKTTAGKSSGVTRNSSGNKRRGGATTTTASGSTKPAPPSAAHKPKLKKAPSPPSKTTKPQLTDTPAPSPPAPSKATKAAAVSPTETRGAKGESERARAESPADDSEGSEDEAEAATTAGARRETAARRGNTASKAVPASRSVLGNDSSDTDDYEDRLYEEVYLPSSTAPSTTATTTSPQSPSHSHPSVEGDTDAPAIVPRSRRSTAPAQTLGAAAPQGRGKGTGGAGGRRLSQPPSPMAVPTAPKPYLSEPAVRMGEDEDGELYENVGDSAQTHPVPRRRRMTSPEGVIAPQSTASPRAHSVSPVPDLNASTASSEGWADQSVASVLRGVAEVDESPTDERPFTRIERLLAGQKGSYRKGGDSDTGAGGDVDVDADAVYRALIYDTVDPEGGEIYDPVGGSTDRRSHALEELQETERKYIKALKLLTQHYYPAVAAETQLIPRKDVRTLFSNIFAIQEVHEAFLKLIESAMESTTGRIISDAFVHSVKCFSVYAEYSCRLPAAQRRFKELTDENAEVKEVFEHAQKSSVAPFTDFPFWTHLNVPVQRLLKYPLLLKEIYKGTPESHLDRPGLELAMVQIGAVADLVNETMRDYERVTEFAAQLSGHPWITDLYIFHRLKSARILEGVVSYKDEGGTDKPKLRHCFLLPGGIVVAKQKSPTVFHFKAVVKLNDLTQVDEVANEKKFPHGLRIRTSDGGKHLLAMKAESSRTEWRGAIEANLAALVTTATTPAPVVPNSETVKERRLTMQSLQSQPSPGPGSPHHYEYEETETFPLKPPPFRPRKGTGPGGDAASDSTPAGGPGVVGTAGLATYVNEAARQSADVVPDPPRLHPRGKSALPDPGQGESGDEDEGEDEASDVEVDVAMARLDTDAPPGTDSPLPFLPSDDEDEPTSQPSDSDSAKTQVAPVGVLPNLLDPTIEMEGIRPIGSEDGYDHMKPVALTSDTDTPTTSTSAADADNVDGSRPTDKDANAASATEPTAESGSTPASGGIVVEPAYINLKASPKPVPRSPRHSTAVAEKRVSADSGVDDGEEQPFTMAQSFMAKQKGSYRRDSVNIEEGVEVDADGVYHAMLYDSVDPENGPATYDSVGDSSNLRSHALAELLETERNYLKALRLLTHHYLPRLEAAHGIVGNLDRYVLFANLLDVLRVHEGFLERIEAVMASKTGRMISETFAVTIDAFRVYAEYASRVPAAHAKYREVIERSDAARALFEEARKTSGSEFPFWTHLNVPIQRLLKYPLLLKEIYKGTPDSHLDKPGLRAARAQMREVATLVNETMRDYERVVAFGEKLKDYHLITSHYVFHRHRHGTVLEGEMSYKDESSAEKPKARKCFLLPGGIVLAKEKSSTVYHFKGSIKLTQDCKVEEIPVPKKSVCDKKYAKAMQLTTPDGVAHIFATREEPGFKEWLAAFENNITALEDSGDGSSAQESHTPAVQRYSMSNVSRVSIDLKPVTYTNAEVTGHTSATPPPVAPYKPAPKVPQVLAKDGVYANEEAIHSSEAVNFAPLTGTPRRAPPPIPDGDETGEATEDEVVVRSPSGVVTLTPSLYVNLEEWRLDEKSGGEKTTKGVTHSTEPLPVLPNESEM